MFITSQILRGIACIFSVASDASLDKKKVNILNGISNVLTSISYALQKAITGAIGCILAIIRNIYIFFRKDKKPSIPIGIIFSIVLITISIPNITDPMSAIPVIVVLMYSWALFLDSMPLIKIVIIIVDILSIVYDTYVGAPVGIIADILSLTLTIASEIYYFYNKNKKKNLSN